MMKFILKGECLVMEITFEELTDEDLEETYDLCMRVFNEKFTLEEIKKTWEICKGDSHYHFIVGKVDGKVVAYTSMIIFHDLFDGLSPIATLWYVCVDENYRRNGLAKAMFAEVERIAEEKHCEIIYFTCLKNNIGAQKFYRNVGYSDENVIAFEKDLYKNWV